MKVRHYGSDISIDEWFEQNKYQIIDITIKRKYSKQYQKHKNLSDWFNGRYRDKNNYILLDYTL